MIAPGIASCENYWVVPSGLHPSGIHGDPWQRNYCNTTYQVAQQGAVPLCHCIRQSVKICHVCGRCVCLSHLRYVDGKPTCVGDYEAITHAKQRQIVEAEEAAAKTVENLHERLVELLKRAGDNRPKHAPNFVFWHTLQDFDTRNLSPGMKCPEHRLNCTVERFDFAYKRGIALRKKAVPVVAYCTTPGWKLKSRLDWEGKQQVVAMVGGGRVRWNWRAQKLAPYFGMMQEGIKPSYRTFRPFVLALAEAYGEQEYPFLMSLCNAIVSYND
jgi:hypothetical protein